MGVTAKTRPPPKLFALDLNCAIYYCVHKLQKRTPYDPINNARWEEEIITSVITYIQYMTAQVKPTEMLYIAVDGVAPMAKIRQQRVRRFKSAVGAEEEAKVRAAARGVPYVPQSRWDTNAITPGTQFMANLALALRAYAKTDSEKIIVSPADEPGEGEQKIMEYIRKYPTNDAVIYGLDADLIVLALWAHATRGMSIDLFREEVEFSGGVKEDTFGDPQFLYMNISHLAGCLHQTYGIPTQSKQAFLQDFVGLMSVLGNDFVPHGMALKIRDEGIEHVLSLYKSTLPKPVIEATGGGAGASTGYAYNRAALQALFTWLEAEEPRLLLNSVRKKLEARVGSTANKDPEGQALARHNDTPVLWAAEAPLVERVHVPGDERPRTQLRSTWRQTYDELALQGAVPRKAAEGYLDSLTWTLAYYSGAVVDNHWYYPWLLPPRAGTIRALLESSALTKSPAQIRTPLKPLEQLAMVLPQSSFNLLPVELHGLPKQNPHAWPQAWPYYSFGRRFLWECEPQIPLIEPEQIKAWIEAAYDE